MSETPTPTGVDPLLEIMRRLRAPEGGCPWDLQQTFTTLTPYTVEEAYEVVDAIERQDMDDLKNELGDLLFQIVFYARLAEEQKLFDFQQVVEAICSKMIRRHPHVFADTRHANAEAQSRHWEQLKAEERNTKATPAGPLDDIPRALPALARAQKLQGRAARLQRGHNQEPDAQYELAELLKRLDQAKAPETRQRLLGELLFSSVRLARHHDIDAESALQQANGQFLRHHQAQTPSAK